ncbi:MULTISPECIES: CPCC family cysteine-rich protein [unclassified Paenibacillus]|uniref:CPCC family cysteine-rich protein n=1 Tax=unclassified Paenibacillus TaxID=185978 RepID=UPI001E4D55DB|nr:MULTISPECIES: CPCC family cysteine-rich protein [unclassified Paenibacillus]
MRNLQPQQHNLLFQKKAHILGMIQQRMNLELLISMVEYQLTISQLMELNIGRSKSDCMLLSERGCGNMKRLQCPCCCNFTIESKDEVVVDICDVCFWQFDVVAHAKPDINIGANHISLNQARENYKQFGVCKLQYKNMVREPLEEELPKNNIE